MKKDPYEKNIESNCQICGQHIIINQFGHSDPCIVCAWHNKQDAEDLDPSVAHPNTMSISKARSLYKQGKPLIPDLDDFIGMFNFYAEVEFTRKGLLYGLYAPKGKLVFFRNEPYLTIGEYDTVEEFREKAHIDGQLLKDIWHEVKDVDYM